MIKRHPFYLRATIILFGFVLLVYILYGLREILVPLSFALLLAVLLNPLTVLLEKWKVPRVIAITLSILTAAVLLTGMTYFLVMELRGFAGEIPVLKQKALSLLAKLQHFARHDYGISTVKQNQYLDQVQTGLKPVVTSAMGSVLGVLAMAVLLPVYTFLFLFYKKLIVQFLYDVFAEAQEKEVSVVLTQTKGAIQNYMFGLLLEAVIVAALNIGALWLIGVPYAVLLGVLGALVNVLPFIGGIAATLLPILIATVTRDGFQTQVWIIVAYAVIQFIDNHFLIPYIVASRVQINALVSIVVVLLGGALWGISGMFLSIPVVGVLKIIFDRMPDMQAWGRLIGTEIPTSRSRRWKPRRQ